MQYKSGGTSLQPDAENSIIFPQALPIRQFLLTNLVRAPEEDHFEHRIPISTLALSLDYMGDFPFKDPSEARYEGPSLFIRGTKSHYVPDAVIPLIGRFFPRFELRDIDCGHWVISEKPEHFRQGRVFFMLPTTVLIQPAVVEFLQEEPSRG